MEPGASLSHGRAGLGVLKGALHPLPLLPTAKMCPRALLKALPGRSWLTCSVPAQQCLVELQGGWGVPGGAASLDTALNSSACGEMDDPWTQGPWKATCEPRGRAPMP